MTELPQDSLIPDQTLFIVCIGRSGSTLLQAILNEFPGVLIRGENGDIAMKLAEMYNEVLKNSAKRRGPRNLERSSPWYGFSLIDTAGFGSALATLFYEEILCVDRKYEVAGCKEVRWNSNDLGLSLSTLVKIFPNAKFLFNYRNPMEIATSGWWRNDPESSAKLMQREKVLRQAESELGNRAMSVQYESYTVRPTALVSAFDWLGLEFSKQAVARVLERRLKH